MSIWRNIMARTMRRNSDESRGIAEYGIRSK